MNTIGTSDYQNKKAAEILMEYSAKKYGRKKEFVEAEIEARLGILGGEEEAADADAAATANAAAPTSEAPADNTAPTSNTESK